MESILIILRGNSGSGKTSTAKILQKKLGEGTMRISQDNIRREILNVRDTEDNPAIELIHRLAEYGKKSNTVVIVEGILAKDRYGVMLCDLIDLFQQRALVYYYELSFEETLKRNRTKPEYESFDEATLRRWWITQDSLGIANEKRLTENQTQTEVIEKILLDLAFVQENQ